MIMYYRFGMKMSVKLYTWQCIFSKLTLFIHSFAFDGDTYLRLLPATPAFLIAIFLETSIKCCYSRTQSRQSARPFLQSSELGYPHSLTRRRVSPPFWFRGVHGRWGERDRGSRFGRGDRHCVVL
jgi:hypothetical protein